MANRKQQIKKIQVKADALLTEVEELISELEDAFENMPESIQYGEKGDRAQERIDLLGTWRDSLSEIVEEEEA